MLSVEENELLAKVGPGTPMGELFRRFWLPALTTSEIAEPDGTPVRLRILGEDLVAFRDTRGRVGIVNAYCAHKLAGLYWGRNEEDGLRCTYHGWKYDVDGRCVDMPNEPPASNFKDKIKLKAYTAKEWGGVIWVYMGPKGRMPELPQFEWARVPDDHRLVSRWLQCTNWCQGMEGEIDTSHISFLHRWMDSATRGARNGTTRGGLASLDGAPQIVLTETDYGICYGARRRVDVDRYYWRVTQWLLPMYSLIASPVFPRGGRAWVPIDDYHTATFGYSYHVDRPFTDDEVARYHSGASFPPRIAGNRYQLPDGYAIDIPVPLASRENDYLVDREMQRKTNFTGIWGINEQDRSIQESMLAPAGVGPGRLVDRSGEHLGTADVPVITARRRLIKMARDLENGVEPDIARHGDKYHLRSLDVVTPIDTLDALIEAHRDDALAKI